jgi:hypothetical protein
MAARMKSTCEQYENERLAAANHILRAQLPKRLLLTDPHLCSLARLGKDLAWEDGGVTTIAPHTIPQCVLLRAIVN